MYQGCRSCSIYINFTGFVVLASCDIVRFQYYCMGLYFGRAYILSVHHIRSLGRGLASGLTLGRLPSRLSLSCDASLLSRSLLGSINLTKLHKGGIQHHYLYVISDLN